MHTDDQPHGHVPTPGQRGVSVGGGSGLQTPSVHTAGFPPNINGRLFAPLQGINPDNVLQGGYDWLDLTDGGQTYHPGIDANVEGGCNADEGALVVSPLTGIVRAIIPWDGHTPGEGNHVWVELDDTCLPGPTWFHVDHLATIETVVGMLLQPGDLIGTCGRSGGWDCAHLHAEWLKGAPIMGYSQWPYAWERALVEESYWNPWDWWTAAKTLVEQETGKDPTMAILTGAQRAAVQAAIWGEYWHPEAADHALPAAWRDEWQAGRWRGIPLSGEEPIPESEGHPAGVFQQFEFGTACWLPGQPVSWEG